MVKMITKTFQEVLCKMTATSQSVFVFFASFSVVIIALDRMRFVVTPGKAQLNNKMVKLILTRPVQSAVYISIFHINQGLLLSLIGLVLSIVFSLPLFIYTKIEVLFKDASYCFEVEENICRFENYNLSFIN